jgi:uncharacterized protein CbrC (UPF0167 family)
MSFVLLLIIVVLAFSFTTGCVMAAILRRRSSPPQDRTDELASLRADVDNLYDEVDRLRELVERTDRGGNATSDAVKVRSN